MRFTALPIDGPVVIDLELHRDERGAFARTFCTDEFGAAGLPTSYPQNNLSINDRAGTLRGMHYNASPHGEAKVVRCIRGAILDIVVDLRSDSATRFRHVGIELTAENRRALFVPPDFAHGFLTLLDDTDVHYHMGAPYHPNAARGLRWDDPLLAIQWPRQPAVLSAADAAYEWIDPDRFDLTA